MAKILLILILLLNLASCKYLGIKEEKKVEIGRKILKDFESVEESIYRSTKILSTDENIRANYIKLKRKVNDLSVLREDRRDTYIKIGMELKEDFENKYKLIVSEFDFPLEFEFYLPNNLLWLIPTNPLGDDIKLSRFEKKSLVNDLYIKHSKPVFGYEIIDNAVYYSVIIPIYDDRGEILGSVKGKATLDNILNFLSRELNYEYLTLIKKEYLNGVVDSETIKDYMILFKTGDFDKRLIEDLIDSLTKSAESNIVKKGDKVAVIKKLFSDGEVIGCVIYFLK